MDAMERAKPKLSGRKVAQLVGLSEGRLRQILNGYQIVTAGNYVKSYGPPDTVARIARAVGLTSADLRAVGRADAADELQALEDEEKHGHKTNQQLRIENAAIADEVGATLIRLGLDLDSRQERIVRRSVQRMLEDLAESAGPKPDDEGHEAS